MRFAAAVRAVRMASICGQKVHFVMSKGVSSLFEFVAAFSMVDSSCSTSTDFDASCSSSTRRVAFRRLVYLFHASCSSSTRRVALRRVVQLFVASCSSSSRRAALRRVV